MFGLFKKSKIKEVAELVRLGLYNASVGESCETSLMSESELEALSIKMTKAWFKALPEEAISECQIAVLAAYVLVAEAEFYANKLSASGQAEVNINAAKMVTKGLGLRGSLSTSDLQLMKISAGFAQKAGFDFYEKMLTVGS
ncbi:hypothetical protein GPUN_2090 [Glaciecola punicea ACAM 611]|uniref:Uncharacterized protein n=1 Tax=Glaciecola punicea ACAM 611 TaxID=1121923 RepID=H5TD28_9ALTE|nr:hypothetical protein [Glaciecola punicea]GAB56205.1 hypothetical protein GPUN_2090 [Glaciecola punicea ACAM 611]